MTAKPHQHSRASFACYRTHMLNVSSSQILTAGNTFVWISIQPCSSVMVYYLGLYLCSSPSDPKLQWMEGNRILFFSHVTVPSEQPRGANCLVPQSFRDSSSYHVLVLPFPQELSSFVWVADKSMLQFMERGKSLGKLAYLLNWRWPARSTSLTSHWSKWSSTATFNCKGSWVMLFPRGSFGLSFFYCHGGKRLWWLVRSFCHMQQSERDITSQK